MSVWRLLSVRKNRIDEETGQQRLPQRLMEEMRVVFISHKLFTQHNKQHCGFSHADFSLRTSAHSIGGETPPLNWDKIRFSPCSPPCFPSHFTIHNDDSGRVNVIIDLPFNPHQRPHRFRQFSTKPFLSPLQELVFYSRDAN